MQMDDNSKPVDLTSPIAGFRSFFRVFHSVWEQLGATIAGSMLLFAGMTLYALLLLLLSRFSLGYLSSVVLFVVLYVGVFAPIFATGVSYYFRILLDKPVTFTEAIVSTSLSIKSVFALALCQIAIPCLLVLVTVIWHLWTGLGVMILWLLTFQLSFFWIIGWIFQWPLLVAGEIGIIKSNDGSQPGLKELLRNSYVIYLKSWGYSGALWLSLAIFTTACVFSGVGLAMFWGWSMAAISARAGYDQLIQHGFITPMAEDLDASTDIPWRMKDLA